MSGEAPDIREQEDCPNGQACDWSCDQHRHPVTVRTPDDDTGDSLALQAHIVKLRDRWERQKRLTDEARAEADRFRVALGKVAEVLDNNGESPVLSCGGLTLDSDGCYVGDLARRLRAILAADPVPLADVREPTSDEAVTDHG